MNIENAILSIPGIIIGFTVHEFCHALAAYRLGDTTARDDGRLTLNPLRHIDIIGFIFILFAGFGWARPVQFNPERLRHPRRDKAIIAAAGPLSNLILGILFIFLIKAVIFLQIISDWNGILAERTLMLLSSLITINIGLFVFNLIPVPPLDGSHIIFSGLNLKSETEYRIMRIGTPILFIILIVQGRMGIDILPIGKAVNAIIRFFF
jgi:Zn-dependent protease